jgi:glycosyltransferase involved in cell wall biosynthesis
VDTASSATAFIDLARPVMPDFAAAARWRVVVLHRNVPLAGFWLPSPGALADPEAFLAPYLDGARHAAAELEQADRLGRRLGLRPLPVPTLTCSVVVCTHRRSAYLPGLLAALGHLDPQPLEVIVVDNDPGERDSRAIIEGAGARYVREDARGLDNARNAGMRAARGDLIAFTDDDCLPPPGWLSRLPEHFASASVAAVTGPGFAAELDTPSQLRFELEGGFNRGFRRAVHDWMTISPLDAARVGVGANMTFRASALRELAGGFPPELDTGTSTRSAGDLYALYRLLRLNRRIVYDPATWVLHRHRRSPEALREALFSYGVGVSAAMTKALVEDGETSALATYSWLWRNVIRARVRHLLGTVDDETLRCAGYYFRGSFLGTREWFRSLASERRAGRVLPYAPPPAVPPSPAAPAVAEVTSPEISVVVPTFRGRRRSTVACARSRGRAGPPSASTSSWWTTRPSAAGSCRPGRGAGRGSSTRAAWAPRLPATTARRPRGPPSCCSSTTTSSLIRDASRRT